MSTTEIEVRRASGRDSDALFELVTLFASTFQPERAAFEQSFGRLLADRDCLLVVAESNNDTLLGYMLAFVHDTFFANGPVCWIEELMVRDDVRRGGVGRLLVSHAESWAIGRGAILIALATRRAEPFWHAVGYQPSATYLHKETEPAT